MVCLLLLTSCGGPSAGVTKTALAEFFGDPRAAQAIELDNYSADKCELTQNDMASGDISERWVTRFTLKVQGEVDDSIRGGVLERRKSDGHWYLSPFQFGC